jgi:hypothetical protein
MFGICRIGFELAAQLAHEHAQILWFVEVLGSPDFIEQLPVSDYFSPVAEENYAFFTLPNLSSSVGLMNRRRYGV